MIDSLLHLLPIIRDNLLTGFYSCMKSALPLLLKATTLRFTFLYSISLSTKLYIVLILFINGLPPLKRELPEGGD